MSDRGRPHNIGQVFFESLGAGLGAYGGFLEQERIRKSQTQQQSFLNRLQVESGQRSQERLGLERERLELSLIGKTTPNPFFVEEPSALEQARTAKIIRETELLGTGGGGRSMFGTRTGGDIFSELNLGFKQREFGRRLERGDPSLQRRDFTGELVNIPFDEAQEFISTPEDTLRVLLQQARSITGEAPTLSDLGKETVFPAIERPPVDGIPPSAIAQITEGLKQLYGEEQWNSLTPEEKEAIIRDQFLNPR